MFPCRYGRRNFVTCGVVAVWCVVTRGGLFMEIWVCLVCARGPLGWGFGFCVVDASVVCVVVGV